MAGNLSIFIIQCYSDIADLQTKLYHSLKKYKHMHKQFSFQVKIFMNKN